MSGQSAAAAGGVNDASGVQKILVVFFKRPVYYRYVADFSGTLTAPDGTISPLRMSGPYEYVVVY